MAFIFCGFLQIHFLRCLQVDFLFCNVSGIEKRISYVRFSDYSASITIYGMTKSLIIQAFSDYQGFMILLLMQDYSIRSASTLLQQYLLRSGIKSNIKYHYCLMGYLCQFWLCRSSLPVYKPNINRKCYR